MDTPVRVLIVEDAQDDAELMLRELRRGGFEPFCLRVETPEAMAAALAQETWDVILADYSLPHFSAPAALTLVQQTGLDLPFIIVSGTIGEEAAVAAMKAGAHDYVMKGSLARLAPAVQRELQEAAERAGRRQAEQALRRSEAYLCAVMDNVSDGVIILDGRGVIESINLAAEILFGYMCEEALGQSFKLLLCEPYRSAYDAHFTSYLVTGEGRVIGFGPRAVLGRHKDGTTFPIDMAISEMRLEGQQMFICSMRDAGMWQWQDKEGTPMQTGRGQAGEVERGHPAGPAGEIGQSLL